MGDQKRPYSVRNRAYWLIISDLCLKQKHGRQSWKMKCPGHSVSAWLRLEGVPGDCLVWPPAQSRISQSKLLKAGSCQVFSASKDTDPTTSQDNLCKCLTTLVVKVFFFCTNSISWTAACAHSCHWAPLRGIYSFFFTPTSHQACMPVNKFPQSLLFLSSPHLSSANRYSSPSLCTDPTAVSPPWTSTGPFGSASVSVSVTPPPCPALLCCVQLRPVQPSVPCCAPAPCGTPLLPKMGFLPPSPSGTAQLTASKAGLSPRQGRWVLGDTLCWSTWASTWEGGEKEILVPHCAVAPTMGVKPIHSFPLLSDQTTPDREQELKYHPSFAQAWLYLMVSWYQNTACGSASSRSCTYFSPEMSLGQIFSWPCPELVTDLQGLPPGEPTEHSPRVNYPPLT